jgi:hypothetical protein
VIPRPHDFLCEYEAHWFEPIGKAAKQALLVINKRTVSPEYSEHRCPESGLAGSLPAAFEHDNNARALVWVLHSPSKPVNEIRVLCFVAAANHLPDVEYKRSHLPMVFAGLNTEPLPDIELVRSCCAAGPEDNLALMPQRIFFPEFVGRDGPRSSGRLDEDIRNIKLELFGRGKRYGTVILDAKNADFLICLADDVV